MTGAMPGATLEQRRANLDKANVIRTLRAELKQRITHGETALAEVLRADESYVQTMRLADLLLAVPYIGKAKVHRAFIACRISSGATLQNVPMVRREELIAWVAQRYPRTRVECEAFPVASGGYR